MGEIEDEYDLPDDSISWVDSRTVRVHGTFPVDEFDEQFHVELPTEPFHTLAGLMFDRLGRMPRVGDQVHVDGVQLRAVAIEGLRIHLVEATFSRPPAVSGPGH